MAVAGCYLILQTVSITEHVERTNELVADKGVSGFQSSGRSLYCKHSLLLTVLRATCDEVCRQLRMEGNSDADRRKRLSHQSQGRLSYMSPMSPRKS